MKIYIALFLLTLLPLMTLAQTNLELQFSEKAGFYPDTTLTIQITCLEEAATIYYTTHGGQPSSQSTPYTKPIQVGETQTLKAIAYWGDKKSKVHTNTYFIDEPETTLPILAVTISHDALFNPTTGLFQKGPKARAKFPFTGANYYSRKEIPCVIEIFEKDKEKVWESAVGFKIFGGMSRIFPQKSFSLYASKSRYGTKYIKYPIFEEQKLNKYKRLVMRNSGSDFGETHFRDALITSFGAEMGLETQAYRPAIVYINGKYWGLYNFREKLTKHYLSTHFGYHKDSVSIIEHRKDVNAGSRKHYDKMRMFMRKNNLSSDENYDYVASMMDVDNFMEYQILQIYIDNQDAGGNIKFWRPEVEGGRWRWILFDTDFGLGHYGRNGHVNNSLAFHTEPHGPNWPNPPWSTLNLRSLLQNQDFQVKFISRFLDRMNYTLDSSRVIERIDQYANRIKPEMPKHWERWKIPSRRWYREIERMKDFVTKRPAYMRKYLKAKFPWVGDEVELTTRVDSGGYVLINEVIPAKGKFKGIYFQKLPVKVEARPYFGYVFSHWEMDSEPLKGNKLELRFHANQHQIKAIFKKGNHPAVQQMIINEIGFRDTAAGDWIEFYNDTEEALDVTNWKIMDSQGNSFVFGPAKIEAKNYLVVCQKVDKFNKVFPTCQNYIAGLPFGLGNRKDQILLYDDTGLPVDSVGYKFKKKEVKDLKTLVLRDFKIDNNDITNWDKVKKGGSPASINPEYVELKKSKEWSQFLELVKIGGITIAIFIAIVMAYISVRKHLKKVD